MERSDARNSTGSMHLDRRRALVAGLGGVVGAQALLSSAAFGRSRSTDPGGNLVVLQLSGGNDGLSTVVPYSDDAYHAARPTIARKGDEVLPLDARIGLHSALLRLRSRYDQGQVAIVEGIGYERPNRSHFKSLEVWHAGDRAGRGVSEGWLGRLAAAIAPEPDPLRVVHVGKRVPFAVHSQGHPAVSFQVPDVYRWLEHGEVLAADVPRAEPEGNETPARREVLELLRRKSRDAGASSRAVREAVAGHTPKAKYPDTALGRSLRIAASLIHADLGTRILSLEMGGYDHHNKLRERHDRLMAQLDEALEAFQLDLETSDPGRRTATLVFSEFGRRVAENGSQGTDHGKAGIAFVLGHHVHGGLHGAPPSLTALSKGDLAHTTDFRSVYDGLSHGLFGVRPAPVGAGGRTRPESLAVVDLTI